MKNEFILLLLTLFALLTMSACTSHKSPTESNTLTTIGFKQEINKNIPIYTGKTRTGLTIYKLTCKGCHGKNTQGAPLPGDKQDWNQRLKQGMPQLLKHTVNGLGDYMPAKGGCLDCRSEELLAAIKYMIELPEIRYDF